MDGKKIDQLWHEAPEDREAPPAGGAGGSSAGSVNHVRSANRRQLMAPQHRRTKFGRPAFSLRRGQMSWNLLRDHLRDLTLTWQLQIGAEKTPVLRGPGHIANLF